MTEQTSLLDTPRKGKPYVWVTWITGLLAGTDNCWWATWYKARNKIVKVEEPEERKQFLEEWTRKHDAMVSSRADVLRSQGYVAKLEEDGQFTLEGNSVTLSGKPDVVGIKEDDAVVYDQKSGKRKPKDAWQVRLYLYALPATWLKRTLRGVVEYKDGLLDIRPLSPGEKAKIEQVLRRIGDNEPPTRTPSVLECRYCDIASCPDRINAATGRTDSF